jgi:hypothetical protein
MKPVTRLFYNSFENSNAAKDVIKYSFFFACGKSLNNVLSRS